MGTTRRTEIVNTLPLRKTAALKKDFTAVKGRLSLDFNKSARAQDVDHPIKLWNKFIPLTPKQAVEVLGRDLPPETTFTISGLDQEGDGDLDIAAPKKDQSGGAQFEQNQSFYFSKKTLDSGVSHVDAAYQQKNLGRTIYRNQIEFFHACGIRKFFLYATLGNGAYTWARLGFLPVDVKSDSFKKTVIGPARKRFAALEAILPADERAVLESALKFRKRDDLWRLVDTKTDLRPLIKPDDFERQGKIFKHLSQTMSLADTIKTCKTLRDIYDVAVERNVPLKAGRLLMVGLSWDAELDMGNVSQMRRVGQYTGGWKYINFAAPR
ncbi:MAG: hypothetical protein ACXW30_02440 [Micavibrio sp.]